MKLSDSEFIVEPFFFKEGETKSVKLGDLGTLKISLIEENLKYNVIIHNTTGLEFLDPVEGYTYWVRYFEMLDRAKKFAEVTYLNSISKLIDRYSTILNWISSQI